MAKWRDTRDDKGNLLYGQRECGRYFIWPAYGGYNAETEAGRVIGWHALADRARLMCREHAEIEKA